MKQKKYQEQDQEVVQFLRQTQVENKKEEYSDLLTRENGILAGTAASIIHLAILLIRYGVALATLQSVIISNNVLYIIVAALGPIVMWIASTSTDYWNYHNRKIFLLYVTVINGIAVIIQPVYTLLWGVIVPNVFKIEITAAMTRGMIILLAQVLLVITVGFCIFFVAKILYPICLSEKAIQKVKRFKITHHIDLRKNKEFLYDLKIAKNLETAKDVVIKHKDRFVHIFIDGASGTGKTSSIFLPAILGDMKQKLYNAKRRVPELIKMLLTRKAYVEGPIREFNEYSIKPKEKYVNEYQKLYKKYPDCGITVIAPNNSVILDIVKLAEARHLKVNVLDPDTEAANIYKQYKCVQQVGINPFFIPFGLSEQTRQIYIKDAAAIFAEVLVAVNERSGASEVYFSDIMKSITTNIAEVCMLARNIQHEQTNIIEIQRCIADFDAIKPLIRIVEENLGIVVEVSSSKKTNGNASIEDLDGAWINADEAAKRREESINNPYYPVLLFLKTELLGEGREKMFDQGRGIRNLISKFLGDPRIRAVLTAPDDKRIDFDKILAQSEITVVNTSLAFGEEKSTTLGLFFLLFHKVAVLRRPAPEDTRSPHFLWIDEAPQYLHPSFEQFAVLYRQYMVSAAFAIQSHAQFSKNAMTQYLKNIFLTMGTHFVFGRLSPEEMETYSVMAGASEVDVAQKTVSETSIFEDNPTKSYSERTTPTMKNAIEGSDMRLMDFQEVAILTIDEGRVLEGIMAKVSFLDKSAYNPVSTMEIDWEALKQKIEIIEPVGIPIGETESDQNTSIQLQGSMGNIQYAEKVLREEATETIQDYGKTLLKEENQGETLSRIRIDTLKRHQPKVENGEIKEETGKTVETEETVDTVEISETLEAPEKILTWAEMFGD